jgi:transcriptional regulator with XRE-family HTH domain
MDVFSKRIAALREERGWTRAEVAKRVGISRSYVRSLEVGEREPRAEVIGRFAEAFGVRSDYLLGLTDEPYGGTSEDLSPELKEIWESLVERADLRLLFSTVKPLDREQVKTLCRLIDLIRSEPDSGG